MARILVADDNSNIQKMVGMALKDQGIDVVAVGNGEAAVRKISDLRPDLVLADVFMPVRNGYEVCEFVKTDTKLAHIPVILLVGAFDPLDEQEAQRVGADGVLKKPFVPPDPLISMVKSALARAGVPLMPEQAPAVAPAPPAAAPKVAPFEVPQEQLPALNLGTIPFTGGEHKGPGPVTIPEGTQAPAFGSLLRTGERGASAEPESDPSFLVAQHPELDADRAWNARHTDEETPEEEPEEEEAAPSWRRDGGDEVIAGTETRAEEDKTDWRKEIFASIMGKKRELAALAEEKSPAPASEIASANREGEPAPSSEVTEPWREASTSRLHMAPPAAEPPVRRTTGRVESARGADETEPTRVAESKASIAPPGVEKQKSESPAPPWFRTQSGSWDTEVQKATHLAETWDIPVSAATSIHEAVAEVQKEQKEEVRAETEASREETPRTAREPFAPPHAEVSPAAPAETPAPAAAPGAEASVDALVAKVLERISPEMLQRVTRDLLKPVVEAMVRGELDAKK